jgi:hypothetical protein
MTVCKSQRELWLHHCKTLPIEFVPLNQLFSELAYNPNIAKFYSGSYSVGPDVARLLLDESAFIELLDSARLIKIAFDLLDAADKNTSDYIAAKIVRSVLKALSDDCNVILWFRKLPEALQSFVLTSLVELAAIAWKDSRYDRAVKKLEHISGMFKDTP